VAEQARIEAESQAAEANAKLELEIIARAEAEQARAEAETRVKGVPLTNVEAEKIRAEAEARVREKEVKVFEAEERCRLAEIRLQQLIEARVEDDQWAPHIELDQVEVSHAPIIVDANATNATSGNKDGKRNTSKLS
jgi:hypothetical protein